MRVSLHLSTAAMLVALAPAPGMAQGSTTEADTREVQAYRLTLPKMKQLNDFLVDANRQREADPARQQLLKKKQEVEALSAKDQLTQAEQARLAQLEREISDAEVEEEDAQPNMDQSLSEMAARMSADPRIAGALKRAGLAPREAATLQLAFIQAALTAGLLEAGTIQEIPKEVNGANVKFLQDHKAEIAALKGLGSQERG